MLSEEAGGEGSDSSTGMGAGLEGGGIVELDVTCVGEVFPELDRGALIPSWVVFVGLSSGVGVDIGELVS